MKRFLVPMLIGSAFAAWTVLVFYFPHSVPEHIVAPLFYFVFPGLILGYFAGNNVHDPRIWVAVIGNFFFYFEMAYIATMRWKKYKIRARTTQ